MNNAGQHGRQPPAQQAASSSSDPRTRNHSSNNVTTQAICRDYIWGICSMGSQCIHRHALEFEAMKEVLKFCHDHQNKTGCTRPDCTYLHTSREEENLFLTTGQIPRILMERYARMEYLSDSAVNENMPPQGMYDYIVQPPPPPPPPPPPQAPVPTGVLHSPHQPLQPQIQPPMMVGPIQGPMQCPMQGPNPGFMQGPMQGHMQMPNPGTMQGCLQDPMQGPIQNPLQAPMQTPMPIPMQCPSTLPPMPGPMPPMSAPMPPMSAPMPPMTAPMPPMPPPPPPPPPTSSLASVQMTGPLYSGSATPVQYHSTPSQPLPPTQALPPSQPLPAIFDPSRPPPPFQSSSRKRSLDACEAGPSKLRKTDVTNESSCENCMQRLIRLKVSTSQAEQIQEEIDAARKELAAKKEDYERKKLLLRTLMNPEMFRLAEYYIEKPSSDRGSSREEQISTSANALSMSPSDQDASWADLLSPSSSYNMPTMSSSSGSSSMLHTLLNLIVGREPAPAPSEEGLLQQLSSRPRPSNSGASELSMLSTFLELFRNERTSSASDSRSVPVSVPSVSTRSFSESSPSTSRGFDGAVPSAVYDLTGYDTVPRYSAPGAGPARQYHPGVLDSGNAAGVMQNAPPGAGPTRQYHPGVLDSGNPAGVMQNAPPVSAPQVYMSSGMPPGTMPNGGMPPGPMPNGGMPPGAMPNCAMPPGPMPPGNMPSVSPSSAPPMYMQTPVPYNTAPAAPAPRQFYAQMPYNGPPYPGSMPQQAPRPALPPNPNYFHAGRYPSQTYYPPYQ